MKYFEAYVYLAENSSEYNEIIQKAIEDDNLKLIERRIEFAKDHTWEISVNSILKLEDKDDKQPTFFHE